MNTYYQPLLLLVICFVYFWAHVLFNITFYFFSTITRPLHPYDYKPPSLFVSHCSSLLLVLNATCKKSVLRNTLNESNSSLFMISCFNHYFYV